MKMEAVRCDLNDLESIRAAALAVIEAVPEETVVELKTNLHLSLAVLKKANGVVRVAVDGDWEQAEISTTEKHLDKSMHRFLAFPKDRVGELAGGKVAHELFKFIKEVETVLYGEFCKEETVFGLDLVLFWIREGFMPEKRTSSDGVVSGKEMLEGLSAELLEYQKLRDEGGDRRRIRDSIYTTELVYDPVAAAAYWEELKQLFGYVESKNN